MLCATAAALVAAKGVVRLRHNCKNAFLLATPPSPSSFLQQTQRAPCTGSGRIILLCKHVVTTFGWQRSPASASSCRCWTRSFALMASWTEAPPSTPAFAQDGTAGFGDELRAPCVAIIAFSQPFFSFSHCIFSGISSQSTGLMSRTALPARCSRCFSALQGAPSLAVSFSRQLTLSPQVCCESWRVL